MTTYTVKTTADLQSALSSASGGDTILLAPGQYDNLLIQNLAFSAPVTIASQDPNNPAVLTSLDLTGSRNLSFSHVNFSEAGQSELTPVAIYGSNFISMDHVSLYGQMGGNPQVNLQTDMFVQNSNHVSITNSEFQQSFVGLALEGDNRVTVSGNSFHDIVDDGVHGGGDNYVNVTNNQFFDFYPIGDPKTGGNHPDAVQFWTTGYTTASKDISITYNTMYRGLGEPIHGVFIKDTSDSLPFVGLKIANNTIIGEGSDGIAVESATAPIIANNLIQGFSDVTSQMRLLYTRSAVVYNNHATQLIYEPTSLDVESTGNTTIGPAIPDMQFSASSAQLAAGLHTLVLSGFHDITGQANDLNDTIVGNTGNDTFIAGIGNDSFTGGGGTNDYLFPLLSGQDVISNFGAGGRHETIDISAYLNAGLNPTVQDGTGGLTISFLTGTSIQLLGVHPGQLITTASGFTI